MSVSVSATTAPETPGSETPSLLGKLARKSFQRETHQPNLLVGT